MREYLLGVVAACMICVLAMQMVRGGSTRRLIRFAGGLLILLVVAQPLLKLSSQNLSHYLEELEEIWGADTASLEEDSQQALARHVKQTTQRYIEQKATELGATIQAEVTLTQEEYPTPWSVRLTGSATSEQCKELSLYLSRDLGIDAQRQEWNLYG